MSTYYNPTIVTDGLILCLDAANTNSYPGTGTTWYDLSGNNNNGTINGPVYSSNGYFTYNSTAITTIPMTNLKPTSGITQEVWFLLTNNTGTQQFIGYQYGNSYSDSYALWYNGSNYWAAGVNIGGNFNYQLYNFTLNTNTWYHFVHTYDGASQSMYINGFKVMSWATTGSISYDINNISTTIGNDYEGPGYNSGATIGLKGNLSIARIYNRALSSSEVFENFNALRSRFGI